MEKLWRIVGASVAESPFNDSVFARWVTLRSGPHPPTPAPVQSGATRALRFELVITGASLTGAGEPGNGVLVCSPLLPGKCAMGTRFRERNSPRLPERERGQG